MRRALWLLPLLALAGCKDSASQAGVKVTVTYEGFRPGCVRIVARDADSGRELSTELAGKGERTGGSLVVGVLTQDGWGSSVDVSANAFEQTCEGQPVVSNSARVTVTPGKTSERTLQLLATDEDQDGYVSTLTGGTDCNDDAFAINPGVTEERCNNVDDNCNARSDTQELRLNEACTSAQNCQGTRQCGANGEVLCSVPNATLAYPDVDRDGHGDQSATATEFCAEVPVPAGFTTGPRDDCDDRQASAYSGAQERCDGVDNDCDGDEDENYAGLDTDCTDGSTQCGGRLQCNSAGTALACVVSQQVTTWYPDGDGDGFGRNSGSVQTCVQPAGFINQGGDCDDGNPFTYPGARELCDTADNNCDNQPEAAGVCPTASPAWVSRWDISTSQLWHSVSTWTKGGVWVVGDNNRRAVLSPGGTSFVVTTAGCGTVGSGSSSSTAWYSVWADPTNGRAWFGSAGGRMARQDPTDTGCTEITTTNLATYGLVGLRTTDTLLLYGASDSATNGEGRAFIWNGVDAAVFNANDNALQPVFDIHGSSRDTLFAVGGYVSSATPRIFRYSPGTGRWVNENVESSVPVEMSRLDGLWVVNEKLAFTVGDLGSALRWNGTAWSHLPFPNTHDLTSVVAFGASSAYATCTSGHIYRYNGQNWQQIHHLPGVQFADIAGTSPEDLWVVGNNGRILHWPQ